MSYVREGGREEGRKEVAAEVSFCWVGFDIARRGRKLR